MLEIFQYGFMVRAFAAGTMIGIIAPLIGTFLVIRRYSRLADTLAHVSLAGVAVGLLTRTYLVNLFWLSFSGLEWLLLLLLSA
jgi:zinc transport system permease protein